MKCRFLFNSIRFKLVFIFLVFTLPLISFLAINNSYAINVVRNQVAQSNKNLVSLYMGQIDRNLEEADKYLYNLAALNTDLLNLELPEDCNSLAYYTAKIRLSNMISTDIYNYKSIDLFFVYSIANQDLLMTGSFGNYSERESVRYKITRVLTDKNMLENYHFDKWFIYQADGNYFLCHVVKAGRTFVGAWVNAEKLMIPLNLVDLGQKGIAVLATGNYEPMDNKDFIKLNDIKLSYENSIYNLTGKKDKFLVVGEKSSKGDFSLIAVIPDNLILEKLPYLQKLIYFIPVISLLIIFSYLAFLRKTILLPINRITKVMKKIKNGDLSVRIAPFSTSNEFDLMNVTFNTMLAQIQELITQVYQEQKDKQKAELKNLLLQINPHFFLNILNVIYQLAQVKDYSLIQEMSLCLVEHFRYIFKSCTSFVPLEDEIAHTCNYLRIQELRFPGYLKYEVFIPDPFMKCYIPALLVQTFAENTIKHAVTLDSPVIIHIDAAGFSNDTPHMFKLTIWDTGKGFPDEILQQLQKGEYNTNNRGEHIGIQNVLHRLRLLYKGQAGIVFSNRPQGGACVEIRLPMSFEDEKEGDIYVSDAYSR